MQTVRAHTRTQAKPAALLFYRDGVSEGQFREVMDHEYAAIRKVCVCVYLACAVVCVRLWVCCAPCASTPPCALRPSVCVRTLWEARAAHALRA